VKVDSLVLCEAHSKIRSKSLLRGSGDMVSRKMHALRLDLVFSEAQNWYA